jgi:hypothetical protein
MVLFWERVKNRRLSGKCRTAGISLLKYTNRRDSNLKSIANGPLPEAIVTIIEHIWEGLKSTKEDKYIY